MGTFTPAQAAIGGAFIGVSCGVWMLLQSRVAGNSGALKALVNGPREPAKLAFLGGLCTAGARMRPTITPHIGSNGGISVLVRLLSVFVSQVYLAGGNLELTSAVRR